MAMILSAGSALIAVVSEVPGWRVVVVVMSAVFAVQLAGIVIGWRAVPTGRVRKGLGAAFLAAWVACLVLLLVGLLGEFDTLLFPFYLGVLVGLVLQGYVCIGKGR
ncbi:hypothetical protein AB0H76_08535 [Nocardia sp. NPDC050712]|uniref:hypothetical protein n=1 Tax=Nocardia sp. NPDC050712 TaxID=3155518 RepID=UPI0033C276B8